MLRVKNEFELKLTGPPADIARATALDFLLAAANGPPDWARLTTEYFDTTDQRLAKAGISLRIREEAGARTLTGKISHQELGALVRREAERELTPDDENLHTGIPEIDLEIDRFSDDLCKIARTTTDRWSILAAAKGAILEISAEIGRAERLVCAPAISQIAEIEIELLKGAPSAAFDFARRLIEASDGRLRLSVESKLDLALRGGAAPPLQGPIRIAIPANATAMELISLSFRPVAMRVISAAHLAAACLDPDAIKLLRTSLRRLRALEQVFRRRLSDETLRRLAASAKEYARKAAIVRDLDVFHESCARLAAAKSILPAAEAERSKEAMSLSRDLGGREFNLFLLSLAEAAINEPWRLGADKILSTQSKSYATDDLEMRWSKLVKAGEEIDAGDAASLHAFRIDLKKFRYAAQFFRDLFPPEHRKRFFAAMSGLQDALGAANDAAVAQEIVERLRLDSGASSAKAAGFIAGYKAAESAGLSAASIELWRRLRMTEPFWRGNSPSTD